MEIESPDRLNYIPVVAQPHQTGKQSQCQNCHKMPEQTDRQTDNKPVRPSGTVGQVGNTFK